MKKILATLLLLLPHSIANAQVPAGNYVKEDYPNEWAFTIDEIGLWCLNGNQIYVMDYDTDIWYGINGPAKVNAATNMMLDDITPIWLNNPDAAGTKMNLTFWINEGLKLCKH